MEWFMQVDARSVLPPAIAALAVSLSFSALVATTAPARTAETCLAAPKGTAPQGSHWHYRLERGTQRKCWRLVQQELKSRNVAAQASARREANQETDEPAAAPSPRAAKRSAGRLMAAPPTDPQAPVTTDAGNIRDTPEANGAAPAAQAVQWPDPPVSGVERPAEPVAAIVAPTETAKDASAPAAMLEQPVQQSSAAADNVAAAPAGDGSSTLRFVFAALAAFGLLLCAMFYIAGARRRRTDVLSKAQHLNRLPLEVPAAADAATFQPLPPMDLIPRHDDVDEALQRVSRRWKHRAA